MEKITLSILPTKTLSFNFIVPLMHLYMTQTQLKHSDHVISSQSLYITYLLSGRSKDCLAVGLDVYQDDGRALVDVLH